MEANICDINHLDADVLLPPRKRLLAGFKKQSSDGNVASSHESHPPMVASSSSSPPSSPCSSELNARVNNMMSSHLGNPNLSPVEIAETARSAAIAAVKAAEAARVAAQEKAAVAAKAVAAAKSALDLVASFSEEATGKERSLKKNKLKKHVPVQLLYKKHQPIENYRTDEELARRLHRAMNSSPRISKNSSSSDLKGHKHKKSKISPTLEKTRVSNGSIVLGGNPPSICNGHAVAGDVDSEGSIHDMYIKADEKESKCENPGQLETDNGEAESSHSKEKLGEDACSPGKKRGRVKLKKLPLSMCSSRDQANSREEIFSGSSPLTEKNTGNLTANNMPLFSVDPSGDGVIPIDATPTWKCQEFKAPACVKQNKVMQS